jgi:hypothetical protein
MIARLATVIYWSSLLIAVVLSIAVYMTFVEKVGGSDCVLSEEDQRLYGEDLVKQAVQIALQKDLDTDYLLDNMSNAGIECLLERKSNKPETIYGDAPFYWLFCFLIALAGYAIRYILTGNKNPLPWSKESSK